METKKPFQTQTEMCERVSTERKLGNQPTSDEQKKPPVGGGVSAAGVGEFRVGG